MNLPNILTMSRIVAVPLIIGLFFLDEPVSNWSAFAVYTYACITDFFDGYLARAWGEESAMGRFLDPIADKLLIASLLFMLVAFGRLDGLHILPGVVILLREVLVSGLREFLAQTRISVPVTLLAKWKTTIQMLALGFLLVGDAGPVFFDLIPTKSIGIVGIWIAATLTVVTGYDYMRAGIDHITGSNAKKA